MSSGSPLTFSRSKKERGRLELEMKEDSAKTISDEEFQQCDKTTRQNPKRNTVRLKVKMVVQLEPEV